MSQLPDHILKSPQAAALLKDKDTVERLVSSSDAQTLMQLLNQTSGGGLKAAAQSAMAGDMSQLQGLLSQVMQSPEGAKAVANLTHTAETPSK